MAVLFILRVYYFSLRESFFLNMINCINVLQQLTLPIAEDIYLSCLWIESELIIIDYLIDNIRRDNSSRN